MAAALTLSHTADPATRCLQEIDSVEYGLTDIQEYYANTGALKRAAEAAKGGLGASIFARCPAAH